MLKKVLIVEDSTLQAKMYRAVFRFYPDCQISYALNGLEAMDKLAFEKDIQLIILDINMPKMNGLAFLAEVQKTGFKRIPVIVVSTEGKDDDIRRALEAGAKAYVKKPWKPEPLREMVDKIVSKQ
jgi:two-component system chemotaxis response regulator CheY